MTAALSIFMNAPNVINKFYGQMSLRPEISFSLDNNYHVKNKSHYTFPIFKFKHKQHESSTGLSSRTIVPMASSSHVVDGGQRMSNPPVKGFPPSLWADMSFSFDKQVHERYAKKIGALKEEVRMKMLTAKDMSTPKDNMMLIDTLERLGLAYHFEQEIEDQIQHIFKFHANDDNDLFTTALYFRLLRQHGYDVPSSVFDKFTDEDNKFKKGLIIDVDGLLNLYEASYLRYHGEDILEEAMVFTRKHLDDQANNLQVGSYLREKVARALKQPIHRGLEKLEARYYISIYEKKESKNELLLQLAKLDFNFLQNLYKKEIADLFKWRKEYNFSSKLPYMRDRVMECYYWMTAILFEPGYSLSRSAATKALIRCIVLNDTYGNYGTFEELETLTESLQRWDLKEIDRLPDYLKFVYQFLFDLREEFDHEVPKLGGSYGVSCLIETMKQISTSYYNKAKWYNGREFPTFDDHVTNGHQASGAPLVLTGIFVGMEPNSKELFDWLFSEPKIVKAAALLTRHMNDISTYDREHEEGVFPTSVDCYMIENGVSKQEALDKILEFAEDQWKIINKELITSSIPRHWVKRVLNYARIQDATYQRGEDMISDPGKGSGHDQIVAVFVDPIVI